MNIPKSIRVGAQQYTVDEDAEPRGNGNLGDCWRAKLKMRIDPDLPFSLKQQVLVHEIIEAINCEYDVGLKHHQIELLEAAVYQVIIDNPQLFRE